MRHTHIPKWTAAIAACWLLVWITEASLPGARAADTSPASTAQAVEKDAPDSLAQDGEEDKTSASAPGAEPNVPLSPLEKLKPAVIGSLENTFWMDNWPVGWLLFVLAIFFGLLAGWIAAAVLGRFARRFEQRQWPVGTDVLKDLIGPAKLALLTVGLSLGFGLLDRELMSGALKTICGKTLLLLYTIAVFWYAFNLVSIVELMLRRLTAKTESTLDDQLVPLIRKTLRIFLVVVGVMFVVDSVFQQDVGALLAAMAVAALPIALSAQDSLKNLFGSVTILFDRPFQLGERIVYAGYDGIVEEIGFRSTKVRTLTGHLVTVPNAKIVSDPVENIGRRPSIRRIMNVTITYDTPREKIEQAVGILRGILEEEDLREPIHQVIDGNEFPPRVYFNDYNSQSLNIIMIYWYAPPAYWDYLEHAQKLNLRIFEEFEKAGIEFAFPTQTLYLAGDPKREMAVKMLDKDL
jgi:MscS family membrane protein